MGVFDDKKFEELDWISQATEPIDSIMNEVLSLIPDETMIDFPTYKKMVGNYDLNLSMSRIVDYLIKRHTDHISISYQQRNVLVDCFSIEIDPQVLLDFEKQQIVGSIKVIKIASTVDEKVLENMLGYEGVEEVGRVFICSSAMGRANEIMELLGKCEEGLRTRSERKKRSIMKNRLAALFKHNEWKIKDTELANRVGFWIRDYIKDGNLAALSNFCRLKVMTHKGQPIYSMEEIK